MIHSFLVLTGIGLISLIVTLACRFLDRKAYDKNAPIWWVTLGLPIFICFFVALLFLAGMKHLL